MNNPVSVAAGDWIELSSLSIDHNQFRPAEITVDFTHIFAIIQP